MEEEQDLNEHNSPLDSRSIRRTYLVTYSQANRMLFPTRESFGGEVAKGFTMGSSQAKVCHWACCLESHSAGGEHYHVAIKLSLPKRWNPVKIIFLINGVYKLISLIIMMTTTLLSSI